MKEINKFFYKTIFLIFFISLLKQKVKYYLLAVSDAKVTVKVFSSLTCPHCARLSYKYL